MIAHPISNSVFSRILNWGFRRYVRRFVRRNFNAVRIANPCYAEQISAGPIICFINHPGWWDPMTAVLMTDQFFAGHHFAAPMDADALKSYPILERLGFFPVAKDSVAGAKEFLRTSRQLLESPATALWLTPAGKFHDVRQPASFQNGLSHIADHDFVGTLLAMAIEYTFWNERYPELLIEFSKPIDCSQLPAERDERTRVLENALQETQTSLAQRAVARDATAFVTLSEGRSGIGGFYDMWRRLALWARGDNFQSRHQAVQPDSAGVTPGGIK
ncbi:MAG: lysophospholipid acyltransferase family protein [Planctomycetaceae bacterium]